MRRINAKGIELIVYEPALSVKEFFNSKVINEFEVFKQLPSVIVANRQNSQLVSVKEKIYTRDIFGSD